MLFLGKIKSLFPKINLCFYSSSGHFGGFMKVLPKIIKDITEVKEHSDIPEINKWIHKILDYNLKGGKMNRGLMLVDSYKILNDGKCSVEDVDFANILGWCVEMVRKKCLFCLISQSLNQFQTYNLMHDDIMDNSEMRRGKLCWYRNEEVGMMAVNDAILVQSVMYFTLKNNFSDKMYYKNLLEIFNGIQMKTAIGQYLDVCITKEKKPIVDKFTVDAYNKIVKYKAAYTYELPIGLAFLMSGIDDLHTHTKINTVLQNLALFFQIQDDYLDCFGNPSITGKLGTDIQEGKCSWFAVMALQKANSEQRKIMEQCYGKHNEKDIEAIKEIYENLSLAEIYKEYEKMHYELIKKQILENVEFSYQQILTRILENIHNRNA